MASHRVLSLLLGIAALLVVVAPPVLAQPPTETTSSMNWVTSGDVYAMARDGNTLYVGGKFDSLAPRSRVTGSFVAIEFPNRPPCVAPAVNGIVFAVADDDSGGWFVGGRFDRVGGLPRSNLAHITSDCRVDTAWTASVRGDVYALSRAGAVLYVGGAFTEAGPFGGAFSTRSNLAAFTGPTGTLYPWNPGANGTVRVVQAIAIGTGRTDLPVVVYAGGEFSELAGRPRVRFGAVDGEGSATALVADADGPVLAIYVEMAFQQPVRVWAAGDFGVIGGVNRQRIAAIDATTNQVAPGFNIAVNATVRAIVVARGLLFAGGDFTNIGGVARNYFAVVTLAGATRPDDLFLDGPVYALAAPSHLPAWLYVGGAFSRVGVTNRLHATSLRIDETGVTGVGPWDPAFNGAVRAVALSQSRSTSLLLIGAGGEFDATGAERRRNLAAIDLVTGELLPWLPEVNGAVRAMTLRDGELYVGGDFTTIDASARRRLASFAPVSHLLTAWNPDADGAVHTLLWGGLWEPSTVFAGGDFTLIGNQSRGRVAAIDVSTGAVTAWAPPALNAPVLALALQDYLLYVGGQFTTAAGTPAPYLLRLSSPTGEREPSWLPAANGEVRALCAGDKIYVGGVFTAIGGALRDNFAALDRSIGRAAAFAPNPNGAVNAVVCGTLTYIGGAFTAVNGTADARGGLAEFDFSTSASGPLTSFRPQGLGRVNALVHTPGPDAVIFRSDGVVAGGSATAAATDGRSISRLAFFSAIPGGRPGPPLQPVMAKSVLGGTLRVRWSTPLRGPKPTTYLIDAGSSRGASDVAVGYPVTGTELALPVSMLPRGDYFVRIRAANAAGVGAPSEELAFTVGNYCAAPPDPPQKFVAATNGGTRITSSWSKGSGDDVSGYRFELGTTPGGTELVTDLPASASSYEVGVPAGVFYARLRAVGPCGESAATSEVLMVAGAVPAPPSHPRAFQVYLSNDAPWGTLTFEWQPPLSGPVTNYVIEGGSGPMLSDLGAIQTTNTRVSVDRAVFYGRTVYVRVYAVGPRGRGPAARELVVVIP